MATVDDFTKSMGFILKSEGGFVNHPADPGGATNLGISLRFLKGLDDYDLADIDNDGDIDIDDIKILTKAEAFPIYKKYFWDYFPMDRIPAKIAYVMFDVGINSGQKVAAKLLQKAIGSTPDGMIGRNTLSLLNTYADIEALAEKMLSIRKDQYKSYVAADPKKSVFLKGWLNRVADVEKNMREFV